MVLPFVSPRDQSSDATGLLRRGGGPDAKPRAFGLRILDRPRHVLIAGSTGSGKTTAIRLIIRGIDRLNQELADQETPGTRTDSEDAGHSSTP